MQSDRRPAETISNLTANLRVAPGVSCIHGMKMAISIPDPIFREAGKLARRLKKSRSQLCTEAVTAYLRRHDVNAVTETLNRICAEIGGGVEPLVDSAGRRLLTDVEW
jgi:predicted transcriptional regulator